MNAFIETGDVMKTTCAVTLAALAVAFPATAAADNYRTQSGRVICAVTPDSSLESIGPNVVVCQGGFLQAPEYDNSVVTTGDGDFHWSQGNLAIDNPTTDMTYGQTYHRGNWTVYHDVTGTRFTNNVTGHGIFVSIEDVYAF
ncbi:MAG: hypothetical protein WBB07_23240 [Mycobacterium sp.]